MYVCNASPPAEFLCGRLHQQSGIRCVVWVITYTSLHKAAESLTDNFTFDLDLIQGSLLHKLRPS